MENPVIGLKSESDLLTSKSCRDMSLERDKVYSNMIYRELGKKKAHK